MKKTCKTTRILLGKEFKSPQNNSLRYENKFFSDATSIINPAKLLQKLLYFGVREVALNSCTDYLKGRTQQVSYVGFFSSNNSNVFTASVPQASIHEPLLFIFVHK